MKFGKKVKDSLKRESKPVYNENNLKAKLNTIQEQSVFYQKKLFSTFANQ